MGVTNQQIADLIGAAIKAMERVVSQQAVQNAECRAENATQHADFRRALTEISETLVLMRERQIRHTKNWDKLWKIAVVPVLLAVVGGVIALVVNAGG